MITFLDDTQNFYGQKGPEYNFRTEYNKVISTNKEQIEGLQKLHDKAQPLMFEESKQQVVPEEVKQAEILEQKLQ